MKVSIVTPSYNQGRFIQETIESVLNQNILELEYIIMDGGSKDYSQKIIREYQDQLAYWRSYADNGQAAAIDEGFKISSGDILGWLNSDDILKPGALNFVLQMFTNNKEIQFMYGGCELVDEAGNNIKILREPLYNNYWQIYVRNCIPQSSAFWRRDLYFKTGGLDTDLHYTMDYDLWFRFYKETVPFVTRRVLSQQRQYADNKTFSNEFALKDEAEKVRKRYIQNISFFLYSWNRIIWRIHRMFRKSIAGCYFPMSFIGK